MARTLILVASLLLASSAWAQPYGMGPGMMGGYGPGYGMGPGMMGSYGMDPGMMWGYGPGGYYGIPDLTSEQRKQLAEIQDEYRRKQWALMESMHGIEWGEGSLDDEKAVRKAFDDMAALRKQMFENALDVRKRMDGVLTTKQREELRRWRGG
jgi:Spy/CpxP family protein refolding chaperone